MKRLLFLSLLLVTVTTQAQNIGVDVASPQQKLDVAGGVRISDAPQALAGSVRFVNGQFEFCTTDGSWIPLVLPVATVPPGTIAAYGGTSAPSGWLLCDGTSYSTSGANAALFAAISYAYGGSGANFNVPDLRGRFLRGVDGTANRDPDKNSRTAQNAGGNTGNVVGSLQNDATKLPNTPFQTSTDGAHSHALSGLAGNHGPGTVGLAHGRAAGTQEFWAHNSTQSAGSHSHVVASGGDVETRPKNVYVNYIIKL